jgi:hypothetical protein
MAITLTVTNLTRNSMGNKRCNEATFTPAGTYLTGGFTLSPGSLGLFAFDTGGVDFNAPSGYVMNYDASTGKVLVYVTGSVTPAGTVSKPTLTVTKGAILASSELGLSADAAGATINNNTIASTLALTAPISQPTFTGTATTAAALAELANGTSFTTAFTVRAVGI